MSYLYRWLLAVAVSLSVLGSAAFAQEQKATEVPAVPTASCEIPKIDLEKACMTAWRESVFRKGRNSKEFDQYQARIKEAKEGSHDPVWEYFRKPHFVCDAFVEDVYKELAQPLNHLRASVDGQKDTIERRWEAANHRVTWAQIIIVLLGALVTLVGAATAAFTSTTETSPTLGPRGVLSLKIAGIVLPIILTAVTSLVAFFDFRSLAVAESRASLALSELQSQIEEAVITGCVRQDLGGKLGTKKLDGTSIIEWQARLSSILREDSDAYIKRREGSGPSK